MDLGLDNSEPDTLSHDTKLYKKVEDWQWPIVYSPEYNLSFMGLENLHSFDAKKWGRIYSTLLDKSMIADGSATEPEEAVEDDLLVLHEKGYLNALKSSSYVGGILELPVGILPNRLIDSRVLRPFRLQTGGTVLAAKLAFERGWGINLGGGFHHSSRSQGGGFCVYADISMALKFLFIHKLINKAMIVDLDAHQGNGHERDFIGDKRVHILDVYNEEIYPNDKWAKRAIKSGGAVKSGIQDEEYLKIVNEQLPKALDKFKPDLVLYNAGTDILINDPLGKMKISAEGVKKRDENVFREVRSRDIKLVMVTSGGYQKNNAKVIADSILNLHEQGYIVQPTEEIPEAIREVMLSKPKLARPQPASPADETGPPETTGPEPAFRSKPEKANWLRALFQGKQKR